MSTTLRQVFVWLVERLGSDPEPDDRVFSPEYGTTGIRQEISVKVYRDSHYKIMDHVEDLMGQALNDMGFKKG